MYPWNHKPKYTWEGYCQHPIGIDRIIGNALKGYLIFQNLEWYCTLNQALIESPELLRVYKQCTGIVEK